MEQNKDQTLFNFTGTAKARNSDPKTSHLAADRMNEGDRLGKQQIAVLRLISEFDGETAKDLGYFIELRHDYAKEWPHRRCRELESKLLIRRELLPGEREMRNYITDKGKNFLKIQK